MKFYDTQIKKLISERDSSKLTLNINIKHKDSTFFAFNKRKYCHNWLNQNFISVSTESDHKYLIKKNFTPIMSLEEELNNHQNASNLQTPKLMEYFDMNISKSESSSGSQPEDLKVAASSSLSSSSVEENESLNNVINIEFDNRVFSSSQHSIDKVEFYRALSKFFFTIDFFNKKNSFQRICLFVLFE